MDSLHSSNILTSNVSLSTYTQFPQLGTPSANLALFVVGLLGAVVWDIVSTMDADYRIVHDYPMAVATLVYILSRIATLVTFILFAIVNTQHITNCNGMLYIVSWIAAVSISSTALLFFLRIRAVYANRKYVVLLYFVLWLGVVAGCIFETQNGGKKVQTTQSPGTYCVAGPDLNFISLVTSMTTIPMVNDTLVFVAMTYRLMQNAHVKLNLSNGFRVLIFGHYLPAFSRALLKDGQVYFLTTVTLSIVSTFIFYTSTPIPPAIRASFLYPNLALMNMMGCRLFRHTKLRLHILSDPSQDREPSQPMTFA